MGAKLSEARFSFDLLMEQQRYPQALRVLEVACPGYQDSAGWAVLLELLSQFPADYSRQSIAIAKLKAKGLRISQKYAELIEFKDWATQQFGEESAAPVQVEAAAALNGLHRYGEARELLKRAIPHVSGETSGVAWARLGHALFHLAEPVESWRGAYGSAHSLLSGEELGGALLDEGLCLASSQRHAEAQQVFIQALTCFEHHPYFLAQTHYNLGINALPTLQPEAEEHLHRAVQLSRKAKASGLRAAAYSLRAAAYNGLGAYRRSMGEWSRAEAAYHQALKSCSDAPVKEQAFRGLARTHHLAGHPAEALEILQLALLEPDLPKQMVQVEQALSLLRLGHAEKACQALEKSGEVNGGSDRWLWRIAQAELVRQKGEPARALEWLEGLPGEALQVREEMQLWPELLNLLEQAAKPLPKAPHYNSQLLLEVGALGQLRVLFNGRPLPFGATKRVGELLVFVLEHGGGASSERIIEALWPDNSYKDKRQALWQLVKQLRLLLGWPSSVLSSGQAYRLNPSIDWVYDMTQFREQQIVEGRFLEGVSSKWVEEVNQELNRFRNNSGAPLGQEDQVGRTPNQIGSSQR